MKRYNVTFNEPIIPKDRIDKHKNFDQLLERHKSFPSGNKRFTGTKAVISGMVLLISGAMVWLYLSSISPEEQKPQALTGRGFSPMESSKMEERPGEEIFNRQESEAENALHSQEKTETENDVKEEAVKENEKSSKPLTQKAPMESVRNIRQESTEEEIAVTYKEASPVAGMHSLYEYFNEDLMYPVEELNAQVEGTVILSFSINPAGKAENIEIVQSVSPGIDLEAIRLIEEMPEWNPASVKGKAVSSRVTLPVSFKIVK